MMSTLTYEDNFVPRVRRYHQNATHTESNGYQWFPHLEWTLRSKRKQESSIATSTQLSTITAGPSTNTQSRPKSKRQRKFPGHLADFE